MELKNGTEMVELHNEPRHYYTSESIRKLISANPGITVQNPQTRVPILQTNLKRYIAKLEGGVYKQRKQRKTQKRKTQKRKTQKRHIRKIS